MVGQLDLDLNNPEGRGPLGPLAEARARKKRKGSDDDSGEGGAGDRGAGRGHGSFISQRTIRFLI